VINLGSYFTSNSQQIFSNFSQLDNGNITSGKKWFTLEGNALDGTFYPINNLLEIGWWSAIQSDSNGAFTTTQPSVTITWPIGPHGPNIAISIQSLVVSGDNNLGEWPVNFTIDLYSAGLIIYTETVVGNNQVTWTKNLPQTYDADQLTITVTKVNKPNRCVKLTETGYPFTIIRTERASMQESGVQYFVTTNPRNFNSNDKLIANSQDEVNITAKINRQDSLKTNIIETNDMHVSFKRSDLLISNDIEGTDIHVSFSSIDTIPIDFKTTDLTNIHSVMDGMTRQVFGKIEITYTDPYLDESIVASANQTTELTSASETADNVKTSEYKWLVLDEALADGTFYPVPQLNDGTSVGWWGDCISDSNGVLSDPSILTVTFDPRSMFEIQVTGDDQLNDFPVDFVVDIYDSSNNLLHTENIVGNTVVAFVKLLNPTILNVSKSVLTITKVNKPETVAKITEFFTAVKETYLNTDILSFALLEEQEYQDVTIPIGNVSSNEIDIQLSNLNSKFDPANTQSPLYGLLKKNRKVKVWLGAEVIPGTIEWYQLGVFWTLDWNVPNDALYASTTARDLLELMRLEDFTTSQVYQNYKASDLFRIVLNDYGLVEDTDYVIDPLLDNVILPYAWFDRISYKDALKSIAQASLARVYCGRDGRIYASVAITAQEFPLFTFKRDKSFFKIDYPLAWSQIANYIEVAYSSMITSEQQSIISLNQPITVPANKSIVQTITFNTLPCINVQTPTFTSSDPSVTMDSYDIYAWGINVTFTNSSSVDQTVLTLDAQGMALTQSNTSQVYVAQDPISIRDNSTQKFKVNFPFIQTYDTAKQIGDALLASYKDPRTDATLDARGNIALSLGDRVTIPYFGDTTVSDYVIMRQDIKFDGALAVNIQTKKIGGQ
jgi:hypothetical protein